MGSIPRPSRKHIDQVPARVRFALFGYRAKPPVTDKEVAEAIREGLAQELRAAIWERNTK